MIIDGFAGKEYLPVVRGLARHVAPQKAMWIADDMHEHLDLAKIHKQYDLPPNLQVLGFSTVNIGQYPMPAEGYTPIDAELLEALSSCETIVLRMMDRLRGNLSYTERKTLYLRHLRFWNHVLQTGEYKQAIFSNIPHDVFDYILYCLTERYNVATVCFHQASVFAHTTLVMKRFELFADSIGKTYQNFVKSSISPPLSPRFEEYWKLQIALTPPTPFYMKSLTIGEYLRRVYRYFLRPRWLGRLIGRISKVLPNTILLWARLRKRKRLCSAQLPQQPYVYMALHCQPELTTSPLAGVYVEQELMVEQVAAALPQGWYVVVKEHPNQDIGRRSKDFYNYLAEIPNVVLLDTTYPAQDIIDSSKAIATATGTTAWEALFRGKPVLMFGNFFYRWAQGVFFVQNNNDVRAALQHIVSGTCVPQLSELRRYIAAIEAETIEAIVDSDYRLDNLPTETENCERLLSSIFSLLEESV